MVKAIERPGLGGPSKRRDGARRRLSFPAVLRLPSLKTVFGALAAVTVVTIVAIALVAAYFIGSFWWAIPIALVLLLLGLPPVLIVRYEAERIVRQRKARSFRTLGQGFEQLHPAAHGEHVTREVSL